MWQNHFDKILLINLPERQDRFHETVAELSKHNIKNYDWVVAIKDEENGARGLYKTLKSILELAEGNGWNDILILEDDIQIVQDNFNDYMNAAIQELKYLDWDLFYLGGNVFKPLCRVPKCDFLLRAEGVMSTHAVCYSKQGWKLMLEEMRRIEKAGVIAPEPIDLILDRVIVPRGKTYIANPLLAVQRPGWSDVENRDTDYKSLIQDRYEKRLKEIQ